MLRSRALKDLLVGGRAPHDIATAKPKFLLGLATIDALLALNLFLFLRQRSYCVSQATFR